MCMKRSLYLLLVLGLYVQDDGPRGSLVAFSELGSCRSDYEEQFCPLKSASPTTDVCVLHRQLLMATRMLAFQGVLALRRTND
jgi:hypothetical protein